MDRDLIDLIGSLSDNPSVTELSTAHSKVFDYSLKHLNHPPYHESNSERRKWIEDLERTLETVVRTLGDGDAQKKRKVENILRPLRNKAIYYRSELTYFNN